MKKLRIIQIAGTIGAIAAVMPGAFAAAKHYRAYELVWLVPFIPAFTSTFFWIVIVMVSHFIAADSYKDPKAIRQAKTFLTFFDWLFLFVLAGFAAGGWFLQRFYSA